MNDSKLTQQIKEHIDNFAVQEFMDIASHEDLWNAIDKSFPLPRHISMTEEECVHCDGTLRFIFDKFAPDGCKMELQCPHCQQLLSVVMEFAGYTSVPILE